MNPWTSNRFVLSGPIVRRVDEQQVSIWVATTVPLGITLSLRVRPLKDYSSSDSNTGQWAELSSSSKDRILTISPNVHIHVITTKIIRGRLPPDALVAYQLDTTPDQQWARDDLQQRTKSVSCDAFTSPIFRSPFATRDSQFALWYSSCRRMGSQPPDAVLGMRLQFSAGVKRPSLLPCVLILGGDQLYADQVDVLTLAAIKRIAAAFGGPLPPANRRALLQQTKFTTQDVERHLVTFAEWVSLYLLSWSSIVADFGLSSFESNREKLLREIRAWETILANTATYMIADDHEVSDDWNLNGPEWPGSKTPTGKMLVSRAIAAYFAFQSWGNDPNSIKDEELAALERELRSSFRDVEFTASVLKRHWSFVVPGARRILVLDCRTARERDREWIWVSETLWTYDPEHDYVEVTGVPSTDLKFLLVNDGELERAARLLSAASRTGPLILVVNTPIFTRGIVAFGESLVRLSLAKTFEFDAESWEAYPRAWQALFDHILVQEKECVILAGDVHFSFIAEGQFYFGNASKTTNTASTPSTSSIRCLQVTSSPSKNEGNVTFSSVMRLPRGEYIRAIWTQSRKWMRTTSVLHNTLPLRALINQKSRALGTTPLLKVWRVIGSPLLSTDVEPQNSFSSLHFRDQSVAVLNIGADGAMQREYEWAITSH